ncbi:MAG: hypothetical protein WCJ35_08575 [Planctomycetota bacterium]
MTPALGLLLTTCVLMAAPAKEEDPAARAQATLQRVSKLPLEHQRVWLRLIEQRYGWAVLLTLKPEDAQREQARVAKIVRKKTVDWNDLVSLLRQLDQREKAAIARLVRQYRSDVYETFRKQPRDLVDRQEAWYRIWSLWEKAGSPPEQQDRLMDWLADAIKASNKASISSLPADPKFGDDVQLVPEQLVKQLSQPPTTKPPTAKPDETKPTTPRPPADEILPGPELQARTPLPLRLPEPRRAFGLTKLPSEAVVIRQGEKIAWLPLHVEIPPAVVPPLRNLLPIVADDPRDLTPPPVPLHQALVIVKREALTLPETVRPQPASPLAAQADQHAQVNIEELGTRIEGINLSLRNLEAEFNEKREFTADQLDSLLSRLDILVLRQKDLTLFRDLIASQEQAKVGQIDSSRSIVATMGTRIADLRTRIRENEALPEAERTSSLKQLDELSDRLATITAEK